jgi:predicted metalloprotease with PDZ domain
MAVATIHYSVRVQNLHAHLFDVTLTIAQPAALQRVSLPTWIPGSYLIREFSKNLQRLQATQGRKAVPLVQLDKCSWQAQCVADDPLTLTCEVYAFDNSVRTAWLDMQRGFFNGTSMFLRVEGQQDNPHTVTLASDNTLPGWQVATGLPAQKIDKHGFGTYGAANYEELVDCPVEMGVFWSGAFMASGIKHRFIVAGAPPSFDGARLLEDSKAICETAIAFWHGDNTSDGAGKKPPHVN